MKIKDLIEVLQRQENQEAEVFICESQYEFYNVLAFCPDPSKPDEIIEIHL